jgi:hypothetical protein
MEAEWYQQGGWPLIGAIAVLLITNGFALWKIYLQAHAAFESQLKIKKIEWISQQLTEFYNPLFTLLHVNRDVFKAVGPQTFPDDPNRREAAGELWEATKNSVIIPNNKKIQGVLQDKSHLISSDDGLSAYLPLINHISMYEIFQDIPTEIYARFQFPTGILEHIEGRREQLLRHFNDLKKDGTA